MWLVVRAGCTCEYVCVQDGLGRDYGHDRTMQMWLPVRDVAMCSPLLEGPRITVKSH